MSQTDYDCSSATEPENCIEFDYCTECSGISNDCDNCIECSGISNDCFNVGNDNVTYSQECISSSDPGNHIEVVNGIVSHIIGTGVSDPSPNDCINAGDDNVTYSHECNSFSEAENCIGDNCTCIECLGVSDPAFEEEDLSEYTPELENCIECVSVSDPAFKEEDLGEYVSAVSNSSVTGGIPEAKTRAVGFNRDDYYVLDLASAEEAPLHELNGCDITSYLLRAHETVRNAGIPNYLGPRFEVPSALNLKIWDIKLADYHDKQVATFLRYGWPIGAERPFSHSERNPRNHLGARSFPADVQKYIDKETKLGAILGPFVQNPLSGPLHLSPLNTVPKKGSSERRVIVDLSYPQGIAVNDAISKDIYEGEPVHLEYPSVDNLAARIRDLGPDCLLFKRDMRRAYRQIPVCPGDLDCLGISWQGQIYVDRVLPFGLRSAAMICQRVTTAVCHVVSQAGFDIINYLDDFGGAQPAENANAAFDTLGSVLYELGLQEAPEKAQAPSPNMEFLGVLFDVKKMEMRITPERLNELSALLDRWASANTATRKELESLIGKLQFVAKCVKPGRLYISRLLAVLRALPKCKRPFRITREAKKDIKWWRMFLRKYNGVSIIGDATWSNPDAVFATDACLSGCGGFSDGEYFHEEFPDFVANQNAHINTLELLTVVVACKLWGKLWQGKRILIRCDNEATVTVINSGRCRDEEMLSLLRELSFQAAIGEFEVKAVHIAGVDNRLPDLLSRRHLGPTHVRQFDKVAKGKGWTRRKVPTGLFGKVYKW